MVKCCQKSLDDYIYILSHKLKGKTSLTDIFTSVKKNRTINKNIKVKSKKKVNYTLEEYHKDYLFLPRKVITHSRKFN